ncbi:MAG: TatD family hydrolase, partial [bacterium]
DATAGAGGHSALIAAALETGRLIALDRDATAVALAGEIPNVYATAGLHPVFIEDDGGIDWLPELLSSPRIVALGEVGIDHTSLVPVARQVMLFSAQLRLARERELPVIIHCRHGWDEVFACLDETPVRGIMHAFSASAEVMMEALRRGMYLSFAGMATRANSRHAHAALRTAPLERILTETDAPFMALDGVPAESSEPIHARQVLQFIAASRGIAEEELEEQVWANAEAIFSLRKVL